MHDMRVKTEHSMQRTAAECIETSSSAMPGRDVISMRRVCAGGSVTKRMKASLAPPIATVLTTTTRMLERRIASSPGVLRLGM